VSILALAAILRRDPVWMLRPMQGIDQIGAAQAVPPTVVAFDASPERGLVERARRGDHDAFVEQAAVSWT
jgi:hypothetical protein